MTCDRSFDEAMDYDECRYEGSAQIFRGQNSGCRPAEAKAAQGPPPMRSAGTGQEVAFVGAAMFYGRCVPRPLPDLVAEGLGVPTVNLAIHNAGLDVFLRDGAVIDICRRSRATVIQVLGAANMSNRLYTVHPRRNDRFLEATDALRALYHDVDFTEFNFTQHMLRSLWERCPKRFGAIEHELQAAWTARMRLLLDRIGGRITLLWMSEAPCAAQIAPADRWRSPLFVTAGMVAALRKEVSDLRFCRISATARATQAQGMMVGPDDARMAARLVGPSAHREAAAHIIDSLADLGAGTQAGPPRGADPQIRSSLIRPDQSFSTSSGTAVKRSATSP